MACCVLVAMMIGAALAIGRVLGGRPRRDSSPLTWRLYPRDR